MIRSCLDTIYLNYNETFFESALSRSNYEKIDLFPKTKKLFELLSIPREKFYLKNNSIATKLSINHEGIYLSFKSVPPKAGHTINHNHKRVSIQLKSEWMLKEGYSKFLEIYNSFEFDSISKIEVAFDIPDDFVQETMNIFINSRDKITKFDGQTQIFLNLDYQYALSIAYFNSSVGFKLYDKSIELEKNNSLKKELYYLKNPDFLNKKINRLEIGYATSKRINHLFDLKDEFKNNKSEIYIINIIKNKYFETFDIKYNSKIKKYLKILKNS